MQVILLEKIRKLGELGDTVTVKRGFARNYLLPQNKAVAATKSNVAYFESKRAEFEAKAADKLKLAQDRAAKLEGVALQISAKASDEGKLFGSIGVYEIVKAAKAGNLEIAKAEVQLPNGPIKTIGEHEVSISLLQGELITSIKVNVVEEK